VVANLPTLLLLFLLLLLSSPNLSGHAI